MQATLAEARQAKEEAKSLLRERAQVAGTSITGIGIGREGAGYCVRVSLLCSPAGTEALPSEVSGVPVVYVVTGRIEKLSAAAGRRRRA